MKQVVFMILWSEEHKFGDFDREKFSANKPDAHSWTLTVKNLQPKDKGLYFCASLYSVSSYLPGSKGASDTNSVLQTPPFIIKRTGESVTREINSSHKITNYQVILWYKQDEHKALKFLGYLNVDTPYPEDDVKEKISFDGDGCKASNLSVSNLSLNDSGVYFCAASQHSAEDSPQVNTKTLLHLSADRRHVQALQHLQPPYKPALKIFSTSSDTTLFMMYEINIAFETEAMIVNFPLYLQ
ncbi:hypothetical protein L3Q82_026297 [Scortum barcoo]|uniref:Uncharacterized protein n=1 Tax=Scortum barcoo TaxID=214431 RepID=A0ACB8WIE1_9TELE|nr:hypothetical protein L3Q82_026297 [Scortum barcoo]